MKKILLVGLFLILKNLMYSQCVFVVIEFSHDSVQILKNCRYEKSPTTYREKNGRTYHVFLDLDLQEMFRIRWDSTRFRKELILFQKDR